MVAPACDLDAASVVAAGGDSLVPQRKGRDQGARRAGIEDADLPGARAIASPGDYISAGVDQHVGCPVLDGEVGRSLGDERLGGASEPETHAGTP